MNRLITTLAAACFALAAASAFAQAPSGEAHKGMTPEQREQMKASYKAAQEACKDSPDRRACMTNAMCAKAPDPAKCQAHAKEGKGGMGGRMDRMQEMAEACNGKRGEELRKCYREQHEKHEKSEHRDRKG
jgi:hypothetical protein